MNTNHINKKKLNHVGQSFVSIRVYSWFKNFLQKTCDCIKFSTRRRAQPNARARTGEWGEELSSRHLKKQGYEIIERRARPSRRGEIDIIATRDGTLVFVEVKTRASEQYGAPLSAVDRDKRRALNKAAIRYLQKTKWPKLAYRFDVVEVVGSPASKTPPVIRHIENAFPFERRWLMPFH